MYVIGVDVGGTRIKCGLISEGQIISRIEENTNTFDLVRQIENIIKRVVEENRILGEEIIGVGVGFPGITINGVVWESANTGLKDCNLEEVLKRDLGLNVKILNDGNMAVLAEYKYGAGEKLPNIVMLTIGTGVGGGLIINGNLYEGHGGGELGHITYEKNGRPCGCGRKGCVEQYVSYSALSSSAKELMETMPNTIDFSENGINANSLIAAYQRGDECAKIILNEYVNDLSECLLNYCNIFRPNKIIIGGGLSYCEDIIKMVAKACKDKNYGYNGAPAVDIVAAKLKNDAGILGASVLFE